MKQIKVIVANNPEDLETFVNDFLIAVDNEDDGPGSDDCKIHYRHNRNEYSCLIEYFE